MKIRIASLLACAFVLITLCGCATAPTKPSTPIDYGPPPVVDKAAVEAELRAGLKDPESARFRWIEPVQVSWRENVFKPWQHGWSVKVWINAKNSFGGYVGEQPYWMRYQNGQRVMTVAHWEIAKTGWGSP